METTTKQTDKFGDIGWHYLHKGTYIQPGINVIDFDFSTARQEERYIMNKKKQYWVVNGTVYKSNNFQNRHVSVPVVLLNSVYEGYIQYKIKHEIKDNLSGLYVLLKISQRKCLWKRVNNFEEVENKTEEELIELFDGEDLTKKISSYKKCRSYQELQRKLTRKTGISVPYEKVKQNKDKITEGLKEW